MRSAMPRKLSSTIGASCARVLWRELAVHTHQRPFTRTVLQLAVEQEFGGPNTKKKYNKFVDELLEKMVARWDAKKQLDYDAMAEYMDQKIESLFNVVADDGSIEQVCLLGMHG